MSAPFGKNGGPANSVGRNASDLSFQNNLTMNFGALIPCGLWEAIPGTSAKIDTTLGLRFMPTAFPLQTRMRADVHFFYVRNRALYDDWMDHFTMKSYGTGGKKTNPPYISPKNARSKDMFATGSLGDYLGLPTTLVGNFGNNPLSLELYKSGIPCFSDSDQPLVSTPSDFEFASSGDNIFEADYSNDPSEPSLFYTFLSSVKGSASLGFYNLVGNFYRIDGRSFNTLDFNLSQRLGENQAVYPCIGVFQLVKDSFGAVIGVSDSCILQLTQTKTEGESYTTYIKCPNGSTPESKVQYSFTNVGGASRGAVFSVESFDDVDEFSQHYALFIGYAVMGAGSQSRQLNLSDFSIDYDPILPGSVVQDAIDVPGLKLPWEIKPVNAYSFRAYEMIYNAFYRDERNNPFYIDGEPQYNKYLPTTAGGEDLNIYKLHYRNWEQDFLTTCVPTPQMGPAPLVGISTAGVMSLQDPESGQVYQVQAKTADDADTIVGFDVTENLPQAVTRSLVNYASSGISINDFRNVNAFQRWLETNIRRGYKYRDQIKAHYDVDIRFDELNMPEFIGGCSIDILPTTVTNTTEGADGNALGTYAGQLYGSGSAKHPVTCYCDEPGLIMAIVSVVPVPNYSQLMPKHFWKFDALDYFTPEFGHIGLQPVMSNEVAPIQLAQEGEDKFKKDVFGYQRAWYEYLQRVDEVHGQFRKELRNYVMNRVFDSQPKLGPDFCVINPEHLNDVFTVTKLPDGTLIDKIQGQIYFNASFKQPIPKYGVPRLE